MLNQSLQNAAALVMKTTSPAQFTIKAKFFNTNGGTSFSFSPLKIDRITIDQDFIGKYADEIDLEAVISPKDYALLQDQGQDLLCLLTITYVDGGGNPVYNPAPIQTQYNVIINNAKDIRKAVPDVHQYTQPQFPLSVRLVEKAVYNLRQTKHNAIYPKANMTQVIHAITQAFGVNKLQLTPVDNTHTFDHVVIPSFQSISTVFNYLHNEHGVYHKGISGYVTGGTMFVYPPLETAPTYDKTVSFYQVSKGMYAGVNAFHQIEGKSLSVVINNEVTSHDLSVAGSENVGTGFIFTRASRLTDGFTTIDSKQGAQFTENPALAFIANTARTVVKDVNNLFHIKATDNPMPAMSHVMAHQASLMQVNWMNADPFQLDPGHAVNYYYDQNGSMIKKTGIVEHAKFVISNIKKKDADDIFGAVGALVLRVSPNATQTF